MPNDKDNPRFINGKPAPTTTTINGAGGVAGATQSSTSGGAAGSGASTSANNPARLTSMDISKILELIHQIKNQLNSHYDLNREPYGVSACLRFSVVLESDPESSDVLFKLRYTRLDEYITSQLKANDKTQGQEKIQTKYMQQLGRGKILETFCKAIVSGARIDEVDVDKPEKGSVMIACPPVNLSWLANQVSTLGKFSEDQQKVLNAIYAADEGRPAMQRYR
jgi:hypothetical protein